MDGRCFSLDFSPGCNVDLEIAAGFCITGGFFVPYLPVWGIVEHWWKELHTNGSYHLRFFMLPCGNSMHLKPKNGLGSAPTHLEDSTIVHAVFFPWKLSALVWTAYSLEPEYHSIVLPLKMHLPCSSLWMLLQTVCWSYPSADFSFSFMRGKKRTGWPFQPRSEAPLDPAGSVNSVFGLGISAETHTDEING